jgi:cytochrome P450
MTDIYYDPYDFAIDDDPFPYYQRLRDEAPVYLNEKYGFYVLSRYEDVRIALRDWSDFSSVNGLTLDNNPLPPSIITMDPPAHLRQRSLVRAVFTGRRVAELEDAIRAFTRTFLDEVPSAGADFVDDFTVKLPVTVICQLLGVPASDVKQMWEWTDVLTDQLEVGADGTPEQQTRVFQAAIELAQYFTEMVEDRRKNPTGDLISALTQAQGDGDQLTHEELLGFLVILLIAGNDTTNLLMGNMAVCLTEHPDQRQLLLADSTLVPSAIEETLRYDSSIHVLARTLPKAVTVQGHELDPSRKVALLLAAANRDERRFPDPDTYNIRRTPNSHIGFGHGVHQCVGAALARLEIRVAFEEFLARVADFEVDAQRGTRARQANFRGYRNLPVTLKMR